MQLSPFPHVSVILSASKNALSCQESGDGSDSDWSNDPPFSSGLDKQRMIECFCSKGYKSDHNPLSLSQGGRKTLLLHGKDEEMSKEAETIKPARVKDGEGRASSLYADVRLKPATTAQCLIIPFHDRPAEFPAETTITAERCSRIQEAPPPQGSKVRHQGGGNGESSLVKREKRRQEFSSQ